MIFCDYIDAITDSAREHGYNAILAMEPLSVGLPAS
jgi:hypothetical protein